MENTSRIETKGRKALILALISCFVTCFYILGHGAADVQVLHQLLSQHLPLRQAVRGQVLGGDVPPDPPGRLQVHFIPTY